MIPLLGKVCGHFNYAGYNFAACYGQTADHVDTKRMKLEIIGTEM